MQKILLFALIVMLVLISACDDSKTKLTEVDMQDLVVPQSFNYEMTGSVDVDLKGSWRIPLFIKTTSGALLFKAQMNPLTGINTSLVLPKTITEVVVEYHSISETISAANGNMDYDFRVGVWEGVK
ncbi:MAG: hypothetical protein GX157_08570 [Candidatus Cloacimonetes bacterium]|nr:hypothetical protein [Candidatus Cloacimonadota bacterium]